MNAEKMLELQIQVRQNQQEMLDYSKELDTWADEMKQKEAELKNEPVAKDEKLPPVRNSLLKKKKKKKKKKLESDDNRSNKSKKIHGYDYRAWDKFDVDKACEEVDKTEQLTPSESETDEEWEEQRKKQQADQLKDEGNQYFKDGKYVEAIDCYTRGLGIDGENILLFANRAMALLKQHQYAAAELDCTEAIVRDSSYVKAYCRRATARCALKKYHDARDDYRQVLQHEPNNKLAKTELQLIDKTLNPPAEVLDASAAGEVGIVKPIYKKPADRSKLPLRRIQIEEIGVEEDKAASTFRRKVQMETTDAAKSDLFSVDGKMMSLNAVADGQNGDGETMFQSDSESNERLINVLSSDDTPNEGQGDGDAVCSGHHKPSVSSSVQTRSTPVACINVAPSLSKSSTTFSVPMSSFQFQADWKILKHQPENFYNYFNKIAPETYRQIFGEAGDAEIVSAVINLLKTFYLCDGLDMLPVLQQLTTIKRFSMTVMFLSNEDKQVLHDLFEHLSNAGQHSSSDIESLRNTYEL